MEGAWVAGDFAGSAGDLFGFGGSPGAAGECLRVASDHRFRLMFFVVGVEPGIDITLAKTQASAQI